MRPPLRVGRLEVVEDYGRFRTLGDQILYDSRQILKCQIDFSICIHFSIYRHIINSVRSVTGYSQIHILPMIDVR